MSERVRIFDTTLRDGEQSPGVALNPKTKLAIAEKLGALGVDVIEAGFPSASEGDFASVANIAETVRGPIIAGLARLVPGDIDAVARATEKAEHRRIHVFIATSELHMARKLQMEPAQVLERIDAMVRYARSLTEDIEFSAEDATRTDDDFLDQAVTIAVKAGATTINIPDTVGYTTPGEYTAIMSRLRRVTDAIKPGIVLSVHCHNDIGLAVANSLAGVMAGARQVEVAVNGIGERAGNAALEEVVMAIRNRGDYFGVDVGVNTREIFHTSQLVSRLTGMVIQPNKAIVGQNAFRHESGIHQDGMLKDRRTYEVLRPEDIGVPESLLILGKHSGRHALRTRLETLGLKASEEDVVRIQARIKALAELKNEINDADLEAVWSDEVLGVREDAIVLEQWHVSTGSEVRPTAQVMLQYGGKTYEDAGIGDGPVHAVFNAIARALSLKEAQLTDYRLTPISPGEGGLATAVVGVELEGSKGRGQATASDVMEASVKAMVSALGPLVSRIKGSVVA